MQFLKSRDKGVDEIFARGKRTYECCEEQPTQRMLPDPLPPVIEGLGDTRRCYDDYECNQSTVEQDGCEDHELLGHGICSMPTEIRKSRTNLSRDRKLLEAASGR